MRKWMVLIIWVVGCFGVIVVLFFLLSGSFVGRVRAEGVCEIRGYKLHGFQTTSDNQINDLKIVLDGGQQSVANPYFFSKVSAGVHTISILNTSNQAAGWTMCTNEIGCHTKKARFGNTISLFDCPVDGFVEIYWHVVDYSEIQGVKKIYDYYFNPAVDSEKWGFGYAYAPSIVYRDGKHYMFYCSKTDDTNFGWDYIRLSSSEDGWNWSEPKIVLKSEKTLQSNGLFINLAVCDPSIVFSDGFYYLYVTNAEQTVKGADMYKGFIGVARSANIEGPYSVLTERGTWEESPLDPKRVISVQDPQKATQVSLYGVGQQVVIAKDNKFLMWFVDDTLTYPDLSLYYIESFGPTFSSHSSPIAVDVKNPHSVDVTYNSDINRFILYKISSPHERKSLIEVFLSSDALTWGSSVAVVDSDQFVSYSHNVGVERDVYGFIESEVLVGFGAPYFLDVKDVWGQWNLYLSKVNISSILPVETVVPSNIPEPTLVPTKTPTPTPKKSGDADGNGVVNILDFAIWKGEFINKNGTRADFDGNGTVNILDFAAWKKEYLGK